jgi:hypothetical protein
MTLRRDRDTRLASKATGLRLIAFRIAVLIRAKATIDPNHHKTNTSIKLDLKTMHTIGRSSPSPTKKIRKNRTVTARCRGVSTLSENFFVSLFGSGVSATGDSSTTSIQSSFRVVRFNVLSKIDHPYEPLGSMLSTQEVSTFEAFPNRIGAHS